MELNLLLSETISFLKDHNRWLEEDIPEAIREPATKFNQFVKEKLFAGNERAKKLAEEFLQDIDNPILVSKLEVRIEYQLEGNPGLQIELEELITDLSRAKERNIIFLHFNSILTEMDSIQRENPSLYANLKGAYNEVNRIMKEKVLTTITGTTDEEKNVILVPWDFSQVAEYALLHCIQYARIINGVIYLVHVVKKDKEIAPALERLTAEKVKASNAHNINLEAIVRVGNIFTTIGELAVELDAKLVIMGTHGAKGMQKFTGSYALKVIADTSAPFIVIQAPPAHAQIKTVLFPVDAQKEVKQKLAQARFLARYYDLKFILCKPANISDSQIIKRVNNNINFCRNYLKQFGINHEVVTVEGTGDFAEATLIYAKDNKPDLILITITKDIGLSDFILGADEQKIITNESDIPVMCVNPIHVGKYTISTGTTG